LKMILRSQFATAEKLLSVNQRKYCILNGFLVFCVIYLSFLLMASIDSED
jgi:hypothetical protein